MDHRKREFQKNLYFCFIDYVKAFVWITRNCGKFLKRWESQNTIIEPINSEKLISSVPKADAFVKVSFGR